MRTAAFDIGSNSTRMLIAEVHSGVVIPLAWHTRITRLGEEIGRGRLRPEAVDRTMSALEEFVDQARRERVQRVRVVATSAVRDAENAGELIERTARLNLPVEVLTGEREASLTHWGASADARPGTRCLVIDIGGGSTELVLGVHGSVEVRDSLDLGCVRMAERYPVYDPPIPEQVSALVRITSEAARPVLGRYGQVGSLLCIGVAGTATSLAAMAQRLEHYDAERVHGFRLAQPDVAGLLEWLGGMTIAQRALIPSLDTARADVIVHGTAILLGIMQLLGVEWIIVSEHGILYGLALEMAEEERRG